MKAAQNEEKLFNEPEMNDTAAPKTSSRTAGEIILPLGEVPPVGVHCPNTPRDTHHKIFHQGRDLNTAPIHKCGPANESVKRSNGVAFSGGGIRSAAFCSGALRKLLQDDVPFEYLSCVSGGGYTGAAFIDWKFRQGSKTNTKEWQKEFFEHMRANSGYLCNWQNPILGILQSLLLIQVVVLVTCILPCMMWLPYALPVAVAVDCFFGEVLRENCTSSHSPQHLDAWSSILILELFDGCHPPVRRMVLFTTTALTAFVCYVLSKKEGLALYKGPLRLISTLSGLIFAFTAFPWAAHDFLWPSQMWMKFVIFALCVALPLFIPVLRNSAGFCLRSYMYTYILSWKVFKVKLMGSIPYSDDVFYPALMICAVAFIFFPYIRSLQQSLFHVYYRYCLSNAFFRNGAKLRHGDVLPWCVEPIKSILKHTKKNEFRRVCPCEMEEELLLQDLEGLSPTFISNITVNGWQIGRGAGSRHQLMSFSTDGAKLIGNDAENTEIAAHTFAAFPNSRLMKLSVAMTLSGAAVSFDMGDDFQNGLDTVSDLFTLVGISLGNELACGEHSEEELSCSEKYVTRILVEIFCFFPLMALPFVYWLGNSKDCVVFLVLLHIAVVVVFASLAALNTGSTQPGKMQRLVRWCVTHISYVRFFRGFLNINNVGLNPPPVLRLSDGGHFENLALLPLLDRKLEKIVILDGSCNPGGHKYADSLLTALRMARQKLHCSFTGMNGRDIEEDIRVNFLKIKSQQRPRSYQFRVQYYDEDDIKTGEGQILFIAPRHPSESIPLARIVTQQPKSWENSDVQLRDSDQGKWGRGPEITENEADRLTGCCCLCCHGKSCQYISNLLQGSFPHHITANQFFTPDMFSVYHREGYAACVEADVSGFLKTS